jgi:murein DD-endopeptidase MepM/ murein hydrolase activator NlpD
MGVAVLATQNGTVISAVTTNTTDCGLSVNLAAESGVTFRYCHLDSVVVTCGPVVMGQPIGPNGMTGNAKGPHVHFVYLDAPNVTGSGTDAQKSRKVNQYIDGLCR